MDFIKALPPRPPSENTRLSESHKQASSSPFKDIYDYITIDNGNPNYYMNSDAALFSAIINESLEFNLTGAGFGLGLNGTFNGSLAGNGTLTADGIADEELAGVIITAVTSIILGLMILITVIGNVFVIAAIILERNLQNVANYLVASLAVADLFVACLVMPLGAVYEICGWILGPELCDIWTSCDVLCCTASILHLVAIATDRYWAVTNVDYIHSRTSKRVFTMIFLVWFAAVIVSLAPQFGWKDPDYLKRIEEQKCMVSQDVAYQVFATCCTFYVPLLVILVLYWKIYQTARKRIHRRRHDKPIADNNSQSTPNTKSGSRIPFRLARFTAQGRSTLGLVEGNSTNTVNTVEDTEFSSNEKKGVEVTSFNNSDEKGPTSSSSHQIHTVSHFIVNQSIENNSNSNNNSSSNNNNNNNSDQNSGCDVNNSHGNNNNNNNKTSSSNTNSNSRVKSNSNPQLNASLTPVSMQSQIMIPTTPTQPPHSLQHHLNQSSQVSTPVQHCTVITATSQSVNNPQTQVTKRKETLEAKRERKAAKTLAIITGAFVVCWLPFFLMALLLPLCETCQISDTISSFFLWLGYFNSTLNPVIYTIFSPEFRQAFKRILFGAHRNSYYRSGKF